MAKTQNKALVFKKVPDGLPKAGQDIVVENREIDLDQELQDGSILVKNLYISLDPYMRGKMREAGTKSYSPPYPIDQPMTSLALAKVLKSKNDKFKEGAIIRLGDTISEYAVVPEAYLGMAVVIDNPHNLDIAHYIGALGMPGLTAYSSFYDIGKPKKGETIFISAASGAVGQIVLQLAKHEGLTVIGSVGDDQKLEYLQKELGCDKAFNYKKEKPADALARLAPDGIDIYYENVGGETLDAALNALKERGRIIGCGAISQYNLKPEERYGVKNLVPALFAKKLTIRGFIVGDEDMGPKYAKEHAENVSKWIADGSFKALLHVTEGIDNAAEALLELFSGKNFGKAVLKL